MGPCLLRVLMDHPGIVAYFFGRLFHMTDLIHYAGHFILLRLQSFQHRVHGIGNLTASLRILLHTVIDNSSRAPEVLCSVLYSCYHTDQSVPHNIESTHRLPDLITRTHLEIIAGQIPF